MRFSSRRARLSDVAKLAGVSSQTVSRVVRGASVVAPETRERVLAAVEELGYRPNLAARSLSNRRTGVIHVVNATPLFGGHARTFLSIVSELGRLGYQTSVAGSPKDQNPTLDQLVPLGVDGIVVLGGHAQSADLVSVVHGRIPAVFVGQRFDLPDDVASVAIDQDAAARKATNHLVELGRRRLLHICGPSDWFDAHERATVSTRPAGKPGSNRSRSRPIHGRPAAATRSGNTSPAILTDCSPATITWRSERCAGWRNTTGPCPGTWRWSASTMSTGRTASCHP